DPTQAQVRHAISNCRLPIRWIVKNLKKALQSQTLVEQYFHQDPTQAQVRHAISNCRLPIRWIVKNLKKALQSQ
ncbi:hypothetical protein CDE51_12235, partial [Pasteurella multocida]